MEPNRPNRDSSVSSWAAPRDDDARWRHVTDTARDAIVGGDSDGLIVFWNPAAEQLFGYSESEVLGQPLTLLMPERFHAGHRAGLTASVAREGIPPPGRMVEIQALRRDGSEFPAELSLSSWRDGGAVYFTGVLRDISQRKRMEAELQQALAALELRVEQRTAQLSEMNQRLRQEIAERQRAEREVVEISLDQQRRIGQELHDHAGQRLTGLAYIAKGLELKLVDRGLPEAELARELAAELAEVVRHVQALARGLIPWEVTADELVASLAGLAELTVERSGVEVELWASPGFKPASDDMAVQLYRIATEALNNAVKHASARRISVTLSAVADGGFAMRIEDDGVGIGDESTDGGNDDGGIVRAELMNSGAGLRIMQYRARALGGDLKIARRPEGGTVIECRVDPPARVVVADGERDT